MLVQLRARRGLFLSLGERKFYAKITILRRLGARKKNKLNKNTGDLACRRDKKYRSWKISLIKETLEDYLFIQNRKRVLRYITILCDRPRCFLI